MEILIGVQVDVTEIEQGGNDQLAGAMIGDISAPVYLYYLDPLIVQLIHGGQDIITCS